MFCVLCFGFRGIVFRDSGFWGEGSAPTLRTKWDFGVRVPGSGCRVSGFGFRVTSFRFRVWGHRSTAGRRTERPSCERSPRPVTISSRSPDCHGKEKALCSRRIRIHFIAKVRLNPSGKRSQERLTRCTVTSTMRRAARPSGRARCGASAGCSSLK